MNTGIDYRGILNPSAKPHGRISQVLSNLAGRTFWHKLFDNTPSLAQALGEDGSVAVLLAFLAECDRSGLSVDWQMPLVFLDWLGGQPTRTVDNADDYALECMAAAAAAWAGEVTDIGGYRMVVVCHRSELAVGAMRPLTIDTGPRVFGLQVEMPTALGGRFSYAVSDRPDKWPLGKWRAVTSLPPALRADE